MTKEEKIQELERMFKNCPEILTSMKASKSSHHQRMAYRIYRQPRTPYYPQIRRPSTPTAKILFYTVNEKHLQSLASQMLFIEYSSNLLIL